MNSCALRGSDGLGKGWDGIWKSWKKYVLGRAGKMKIRYMTNSCVLGGLDGLWKSLGLHLEEQRKTAISDMNSCVLRGSDGLGKGLGRAWDGIGKGERKQLVQALISLGP